MNHGTMFHNTVIKIQKQDKLPEEIKLPLLAIINWFFTSKAASFETFGVPISVKSMAISSKLLAEGIFAWSNLNMHTILLNNSVSGDFLEVSKQKIMEDDTSQWTKN